MKLSSIIFFLGAITLSACASTNIISSNDIAREKISNSNFSSQVTKTEVKNKNFNGFIVAMDKVDFAKFKLSSNKDDKQLNHQIIANEKNYFDFSTASEASSTRFKNRVRETLFDQKENLFVTGVFANNINQNFSLEMNSSCSESLDKASAYISCSSKFLDNLEGQVTAALLENSSTPYTHVILHSTGWNNSPEDSIAHYQEFQNSLKASSSKTIKPLFVGLTWPSEWDVPFISLFNKKNDADEMGLIWLNYLMNKTLPDAINQANLSNPPKYVALGHSLGARAMATAAFSKPYLVGASEAKLDSLILLQPAFSGSRFYKDPDKRKLGHFKYYDGIEKFAPSIVVTSSKFDKAVRLARWADDFTGHIGGGKAHTRTCKKVLAEKKNTESRTVEYWDNRYICQQQGDGTESQWGELSRMDSRILLLRLDTGKKCPKGEKQEGDTIICDHSDVKNEKVAEVIWELIK